MVKDRTVLRHGKLGGRRAHQICSRFWGGRDGHRYRLWHSAESEAHGRPASRKDGLVFWNLSLMSILPQLPLPTSPARLASPRSAA